MLKTEDHLESVLQLLDVMGETAALLELDGTVLAMNGAGVARLGGDRESIIGACVDNHFDPETARFRRQAMEQAIARNRPVLFTDQRAGRWYENRICPVAPTARTPARLAIYARDVTAQRVLDQEARQATANLQMVHDHLPIAVFMLGPDRRIIGANQRACSLFGHDDGAPVGLVPGDAMRCLNHLTDPRGCGHAAGCQDCRLRQSAQLAFEATCSVRDVAATIPVAGDQGTGDQGPTERHLLADFVYVCQPGPAQLLVYLRDVTELRLIEADRALKAAVLDQIEDRVVITDAAGTIRFVNDATCHSLKVRREDLVGCPISALGEDPAGGATQQEILDSTLARGSWRGEVVNLTAAGEPAVLDCRTQTIRGAAGQPVALCGISTDITARKLQEERLRESERRFRRLHEQLPLGYFCLDREGRYRDANPAWLVLVGCPREALDGQPFADQVIDNHVPRFNAGLDRLADGESLQLELGLRRADGAAAVVFCVGRAELDAAGGIAVSHWVAVDVSERRDLEDQLRQAQKMDALGRLAAGVAHDFNNQLTVMRGYCDLVLEEATADDPLGMAVQQIRLAAERARATTSQLLAFSRRGGFEPQVVDLNQTLEQLHHPVAKMIGEAIRIRLEPAPGLPPIEVDPSGLQQALFNLIINARDAQPDGGVIILRTGRQGGGEVVLEVIDSGRGMDADLVDRVWEPFFTTKDPGQGTGLGLAMVKSFVEQSGGRVGISSVPGQGTTARICLPVAAPSSAPVATAATAGACGRRRGRILVVEDDDGVRRVAASILEQAGHQVVEARGPGEAAQRAATGAPFDLLLTDVVMPDLGGEDLAALLATRGQVARVVFMSGYGTSGHDLSAGPLITKPFSAAGLLAAVAAQLDPTIAKDLSVEAHH